MRRVEEGAGGAVRRQKLRGAVGALQGRSQPLAPWSGRVIGSASDASQSIRQSGKERSARVAVCGGRGLGARQRERDRVCRSGCRVVDKTKTCDVVEQSPLVVERGRTGAERSGGGAERSGAERWWIGAERSGGGSQSHVGAEMSEICTLKSCQRERAREGRTSVHASGECSGDSPALMRRSPAGACVSERDVAMTSGDAIERPADLPPAFWALQNHKKFLRPSGGS